MHVEYHPNTQTIVFVSVFLIIYLVFLVKKTLKNSIDLFDLLALSSVGIVPALVVFFPGLATLASQLLGVEFPFLLLFGFLFFVVFAYLAYLVSKIHKVSRAETKLTQEIGILRLQFEELKKGK